MDCRLFANFPIFTYISAAKFALAQCELAAAEVFFAFFPKEIAVFASAKGENRFGGEHCGRLATLLPYR